MQSYYIREDLGDRKQISRFNEEGNRLVRITVESFNEDKEIDYIVQALNSHLGFYREPYQSPDDKEGLIYFK
jgi:hypothetical protein